VAGESLSAPGLPRRLAAMVYDTLLVLPLIMVVAAAALGLRSLLGDAAGAAILPPWVVRSIALLCCIGFFTAFWLKGGQTLGMQAWRIKVIPSPGNELTFGRCVTRIGSAVLSAACFGLGYLWCIVDRRKRSWHDMLSGTELILVPKGRNRGKDASAGEQTG
jgi:uncharacterized RDD family membrane protein YckC